MINKKLYYVLCLLLTVFAAIFYIVIIKSTSLIEIDSKDLETNDLRMIYDYTKNKNLFEFDLNFLQKKISELSYVRSVSIRAIPPNKLHVNIVKREPYAVLWNYKNLALIDQFGVVLSNNVTDNDKKKYIFVVSNDKNIDLKKALDVITKSCINGKVASIRFIANRRYDIILSNGIVLKLPEENIEKAIAVFDFLNQKSGLIRNNMIVDMRLIDEKIFLRNLH